MSYPQRVCKRVNALIEKFGGNPTRLSDYSCYQRWSQDDSLSQDWNTQILGETYGERVFLKTSKTAMGKNGARIQEFSRFQKSKRGKNVSLDDLAGFITVFICLHVRPPKRHNPPPKQEKVAPTTMYKPPIRHEVEGEEEEEDDFSNQQEKKEKIGPNQVDFPVVESWEDL